MPQNDHRPVARLANTIDSHTYQRLPNSSRLRVRQNRHGPKTNRDVSAVVAWLQKYRTATPSEFEAYLFDLYKTDNTLNWRFPNGL